MPRINQFAKDHGLSNQDVIEVLEKHLNVAGKVHSSNLSHEQVADLERYFEAKAKGGKALDGVNSRGKAPDNLAAAVKIVKAVPSTDQTRTATDGDSDRNVPVQAAPEKAATTQVSGPVPVAEPSTARPSDKGAEKVMEQSTTLSKESLPTPDAGSGRKESPQTPDVIPVAVAPAATTPDSQRPGAHTPNRVAAPQTSSASSPSGAPHTSAHQRNGQSAPSHSQQGGAAQQSHPQQASAVLVKKTEPVNQGEALEAQKTSQASPSAPPSSQTTASVQRTVPTEPRSTDPLRTATDASQFSRLRVSPTAAPTPKSQEPARYIQLPQTGKSRPEAGAKAVIQRPGQPQVQRSGMPQPEKKVLPMATNTGKGEVKHEPPAQAPAAKRLSSLPSISALQPDSGFTRIKMADAPVQPAKPAQPARYIQLPQPRQPGSSSPSRPGGPGASRPGGGPGGNRPSGGPGSRPSGPGGPRPGGPGARPGGPGARPGGPRPGGPGRGPVIPNSGPIDPSSQKGPGRGSAAHGKKKKGGYTKEQQEMDLKLRQPRSRALQVATEYIENEIGIVMLSEGVTVKELAEKCNRAAKDVMAKLLHRGIFVTINQPLDTELAKELAREFGYLADIVTFEEDVQMAQEENAEALGEKLSRPPVVTIMGHVDHGKTSLLDAIRSTKVASGEAGGITQAIGAYHVDVKDPNTGKMRQVVFIDTPGHEAFTKMRARGAKVTDIVILVVAADDGVMPQTIEAINHTKAADVPMVVAINKIDKPQANADRVQQMLLQHSVQTEAYGGDVPALSLSAKTKQGIDEMLETLLLVADLKDLKAVYDCPAAGSILEAKLDRGRGPVATVLVQQGTLKAGDTFVAGATMGRVRAMFDDRGRRVMEVGPSTAVQILGFEEVPVSGDNFQVVEDEGKGRAIVAFRQEKAKAQALAKSRVTLENLFSTLKDGEVKELPLIIKADTQGSVESLVGSLEKLNTDKVRVRIIHSAAGTVNKNDVLLAEASKAAIIAFGIKAERETEELAQEEGVDIRYHTIIYKVTEEITAAMVGLLDATDKETLHGVAEIRQIFKINKAMIAGSFVTEGKIQKGYKVRVKRDGEVLWEGGVKTLKRFKEDVNEVKNGLDCGIDLDGYNALKEGDILEFYTNEKIVATSL